MLSAEVEVGKCSIINTLVNISHEAKIGDFCHISTCASIMVHAILRMTHLSVVNLLSIKVYPFAKV